MKGNHPVITLLGSNSGNNLGDAAIMSAILDAVTKELPDAEFLVPSTRPSFINKHYSARFNVKGINIMPWTLSIRMLGLPTFRALARSDCALICDGIIFGKQLFNPLFNFLITLIFVVPWARLVGCKMVCYSCGIGPFPSKLSRLFARWVLNGCDLVIMREHDSEKLAKEIGCTNPVYVTGDAAFINPVSSQARAHEILSELGLKPGRELLGVNVTKYLDAWLEPDQKVNDRTGFISMLADGIASAAAQVEGGFDVVVFSTHPMDEPSANLLVDALKARSINAVMLGNTRYLSHDIQSVMRECSLFTGMRFHSLVLASAVAAPIVGLVYAPKVRGYMRLLKCEQYSLELGTLSAQKLGLVLADGWRNRAALKTSQQAIVDQLKLGARSAAALLRERYFSTRSSEKHSNSDAQHRLAS